MDSKIDATMDATSAARTLGVPVSRVTRACKRGTIPAKMVDGHWVIDRGALEQLRRRWGAVPMHRPSGLSRIQVLTLALLVRSPRGQDSARRAARALGMSPTTAARALDELSRLGLVEQIVEPRIDRGRSRRSAVWYARLRDPRVDQLLDHLNEVELPQPASTPGTDRLPTSLWHVVWNADPRSISVQRDAVYLGHRVLVTADPAGTAWAVRSLPADAWRRAAKMRGVSPRDRAWANTVADELDDAVA